MLAENVRALKDLTQVNALAIIIGLFSGLAAILFALMIENSKYLFQIVFERGTLVTLSIILIPTIGGLIVGPIIYKFSRESKGHGIPEVIFAINAMGSIIPKRVAVIKTLVSSITIGSGGSAGREGPIAQVGASIGSNVAQYLKFDERKRRTLVVCGLSSGISATFNTPLGGTIFGLELILGDFSPLMVIPIVLASVISVSFSRSVLGERAVIAAEPFVFNNAEIPFYILIGIVGGVCAYVFTRLFNKVESSFDKAKVPFYIKPGIGGLLTGLVGFSFVGYGVLGAGYEGINAALTGNINMSLLLILLVAKMLATSFTLGSGGSGSLWSPILYLGAMLGGAMGLIFYQIAPNTVTSPSAYALIGMGALFASVEKAPLTCIVLIPELTADYSVMPAIMLAVAVSYGISMLFLGRCSIDTTVLDKRMCNVRSYSKDLNDVKACDIMTEKIIAMEPDMRLSEFQEYIKKYKKLGYPVIKGGKVLGILSNHTVKNIESKRIPFLKVSDVMTPAYQVTPDDTVPHLMEIMEERESSRLIVSDPKTEEIYGIVSKSDILKAYRLAKDIGFDEDRYKITGDFEKGLKDIYRKIVDKFKWPKRK